MELQYISDTQGRHTAVIVPIEDWNNLATKHEDLRNLEKPKKKPSDFRGAISKETADEMNKYVEKARKEWERNIF